MARNRRDFVLGTPLCLAALFGEAIDTGILAAAEAHDPAALDFWTRGMGVSSSAIPSAQGIAGANPGEKGGNAGPSSVESFAKEPLFLHYSTMDNGFIPSDQIPKSYLLQSGDTKLDTQMQRLRLSTGDNARYARYTSGAIYFELQQAAAAAASSGNKSSSGLSELASTVFSAFMSGTGKGTGKGTAKNGKKSGSGPPSATPSGGQAGAPIALQSKTQAQSLVLRNGGGKAAFTAFVKDPRKTLFGQFVSLMTSSASDGPLYAQLLNIPLLSFPGVQSVRALVANLHLQGSSQEIVMQSPPTDIATTVSALQKVSKPLPLREGDYLVVAREHGDVTMDQLNKFKIMDGFLVPKEAKSEFDVTPEMVQNAIPDLSYLTLGVSVKATDASACAA